MVYKLYPKIQSSTLSNTFLSRVSSYPCLSGHETHLGGFGT